MSVSRTGLRSVRPLLFCILILAFAAQSLVAATITVNSTADTDNAADTVITLREAIRIASGSRVPGTSELPLISGTTGAGQPDTIVFSAGGVGTHTPATPYEPLSDSAPTDIDGTSAPGATINSAPRAFNATLVVLIDLSAGSGAAAFTMTSGNNVIRGLVIGGGISFTNAIDIAGGPGNRVWGNIIGLTANGTTSNANNAGVVMNGNGNFVGGLSNQERNVLSGNVNSGVGVVGSNNTVLGNIIGLNSAGTAIPTGTQQQVGVFLIGAAASSIGGPVPIGGATAGPRNVISGNQFQGIRVDGATGGQIRGNYIGTNVDGTAAVKNGEGIRVHGGSTNVLIGGDALSTESNLISGNDHGVRISDSGTSNNFVRGNEIGLDVTGTAALPNTFVGVLAENGTTGVTIGGDPALGFRNVISGNTGAGVEIENVNGAIIVGNFLGTNRNGVAGVGNVQGILVDGTSTGTVIGGNGGAATRNVISGNVFAGIQIVSTGSNLVYGNFIGTDVNGNLPIANGRGVVLATNTTNNDIGGTGANEGNVISGNSVIGVYITLGNSNRVRGNIIGLDLAQGGVVPNGIGIQLDTTSSNNIIGDPTAGNFIAGNSSHGVLITGSGTNSNILENNAIGIRSSGVVAPNGGHGVFINSGAQSNRVGGTSPGQRNLLSGNAGEGVAITDPGTNGNLVQGNFIGTDVTGNVQRPNGLAGVAVGNVAQSNQIGGTGGARNVISGNTGDGVKLFGGASNNTVFNNYIGTNASGSSIVQNGGNGILITNANANIVGAAVTGAGNVISGNALNGIFLTTGANGNQIVANNIGVSATGGAMGNTGAGVLITGGANSNLIDGTGGFRNIISGNNAGGVNIDGPGSNGNTVRGNNIGVDSGGSSPILNGVFGVRIGNGALNNTIGGTSTAQANVISGNNGDGVLITGAGTSGNVISANYIGTNLSGTSVPNASNGVEISAGANNNTIGGNAAALGNIIRFNGRNGVAAAGAGSTANLIRFNSIYANGGLGIDLNDDLAIQPNDAGDGDAGPNGLQNYPVITSVDFDGGMSNDINYTLNSTPNTNFDIDFFTNTLPDPSGAGEGQTFLVTQNITTDGAGNFTGTATVIGPSLAASYISATATRTAAPVETSEFAVAAQADLAITKTDAADPVPVNGTITYTITVTNNGPSGAADVSVVDVLPAGVTTPSASGAGWTCTQGVPSAGQFTCTNPLIAAGATSTITATMTAPATPATLTNNVSVTSSTPDPVGTNNSATQTTTVTGSADLGITKTDSPDPVVVGGTITYTITVTNFGPGSANNVQVVDTIPVGSTFISATPPLGWTCGASAGGFTCTIPVLSNTAGAQVITATVTAPATAGSYTNSVTVSATEADPGPNPNTATATTTVRDEADLSLGMTDSPDPIVIGGTLTYTLTVTNAGPSAAASVQVVDTLPAGTTFVSGSGTGWTCGATPGGFTCTNPSVAVGSSVITATVTVPNTPGVITNSATVSSVTFDPTTGNETAATSTTVRDEADLSIIKTDSPDPVGISMPLTYTITVSNGGPSTATTIAVNDTLPAGTTLQTVSGTGWACTPAGNSFSCSLASLASGATANPITVTATAPATAGAITNTATVSSAVFDPNTGNNSSSAITNVSNEADLAIVKTASANPVPPGGPVVYTLAVTNNGPAAATSVLVTDTLDPSVSFFGVQGPAPWSCFVNFNIVTCSASSLPVGAAPLITIDVGTPAGGGPVLNSATVSSASPDSVTANNSSTANVFAGACPDTVNLVSPAPDSVITTNMVTFVWDPVNLASGYNVLVSLDGADFVQVGSTTSETTLTVPIAAGSVKWVVEVLFLACPSFKSQPVGFRASCPTIPRIVARAVGETTSLQPYRVSWDKPEGIGVFEIQESLVPNFREILTSKRVTTSEVEYFHDAVEVSTAYYYRVRAICGGEPGEWSRDLRVVVVPYPPPARDRMELTTQFGNTRPLFQPIFVADPGASGKGTFETSFSSSSTVPWIVITPPAGTIPPGGTTLAAQIDPSKLPVGTSTGQITISSPSGAPLGSTTISMNMATPIAPLPKTTPPTNALIIPAVANIFGKDTRWQSDIRMTNTSLQSILYQLTYTSTGVSNQQDSKITSFPVSPGQTIALDDIVRHSFGVGALGDGANGVLEIRPLNFNGTDFVASSRTYATGAFGTRGQFVPAVPFSQFVGKTDGRLSMQQIAQSSAYRTNLGVVEGAGEGAAVLISVYNNNGALLKTFPLTLRPGEHQQLNSVLVTQGIELEDGRIDVAVTTDSGKVSAYASVVDQRSQDPQLVPAVDVSKISSTSFVVPGLANFTSEFVHWKSDVRIYNSGNATLSPTLTFFPQDGQAVSKSVTVQPGQIVALDNIVQTMFGRTNVGGALHVTGGTSMPLVITARTYDDKSGGTFGQFISAVRPVDAVGVGGRALQILQVEQSKDYRTNLGLAEVTGAAVTVEIAAIVPNQLAAPIKTVTLGANQFLQINSVLKEMGFETAYNSRLSIRVISGSGRVTAYGSMIDNRTEDPTYIPAQ